MGNRTDYRSVFLEILAANVESLREQVGGDWSEYELTLRTLLDGVRSGDLDSRKNVDRIIALTFDTPGKEFARECLRGARRIATQGFDSIEWKIKGRSEAAGRTPLPAMVLPDGSGSVSVTVAQAGCQLISALNAAKSYKTSLERDPKISATPEWTQESVKSLPCLPKSPSEAMSGEQERAVNFRIRERDGNPGLPLEIGRNYVADCSVGAPVASNLFTGSAIPNSDVPSGGLQTHWTLIPENVDLTPFDARVTLTSSGVIQFHLLIPPVGDSETVSVNLMPNAPNARITVIIYVAERIYRECRISLDNATEVVADIPTVPLRHAALPTTHEWTTPPGTMNLFILMPGKVLISGSSRGVPFPPGEIVDMETAPAILTNPVDQVRNAAEAFRAKWTSYLNDIDADDLLKRLASNLPQYDWSQFDDFAGETHKARWDSVGASTELRDLAFYGKKLYDTLFPKGSLLRAWLDGIPAGQRVNVVWRPDCGAGFPAYIPWELLYRAEVKNGQPIDATQFWGLSYRVEYTASRPPAHHSASLGGPLEACCTNVLFFGNSSKEPSSAESQWQRRVWGTLARAGNACSVPANGTASPKTEIENALANPESLLGAGQKTVAVLYLYCHYDSFTGMPILRFGLDSADPNDVLQETELSTSPLASYPLVFANACSTAGAGVFAANYLTRYFFDRGARAFIGSHCKVPPVLASRLAMIFFHFLLRLEDRERKPIAAGEAMTHSRIFLWRHYRNIGGLLYSYLNQYDLYLASESELHALT